MFRAGAADGGDQPPGRLGAGPVDDDLLTDPDQAFSALFRETVPAARRYASRLVGADHADDVVADSFTVVWRRWADVPRDRDGRTAWVMGVVHHRALEHYRASTRQRRLLERVVGLGHRPHVAQPDAGVLSAAGVQTLVRTLPPAELDAVMLTVVGDLTTAEAAAVLGCSPSAVTTRVSRAKQRLRTTLGPGEEVDPDEHRP